MVELDPHGDPRWLQFVAEHPEGLIYHHPAWLRLLERTYGNLICLACEDAERRIRGVLPLCATRGLPLGLGGALTQRRVSSLPRTPTGGPLVLDEHALAVLVESALQYTRRIPGRRLELKPPPGTLGNAGAGLAWGTSYVLMLPERPGDLRFGSARNHAAVMRAVRKAEAMGVRVRRAETTRELRHWYRLYLEVMRHHSVPPRPYRFFAAMWEELAAKGMLRLLLAEAPAGARRRIVAGSIFLMSGHTVVFAMNGRRGEDLAVRPNEAIHWRAIHDATSEGYRRYDLGEVEPGHEGLERFKRKWGAEPRPLHRLYVPPLPDARAVTDERRSPGALWQRLPLTATAAAGGLLYRFI